MVAAALRSNEDDDVLTVLNAASGTLITWGRYARAAELTVEHDRRGVEVGASSWAAQLTVRAETALGQSDLAQAQRAVSICGSERCGAQRVGLRLVSGCGLLPCWLAG